MNMFSDDEFTKEELLETCLSHGLIEEEDQADYEHWQLLAIVKEYNEEVAAQDFYASTYSY